MKNILAIVICLPIFLNAQDSKVDETVSVNKIKSHIYFLASDALRGRDTGSPELKIAAEYIVSRFREYGVRPIDSTGYLQSVPFKKITAPISGIVSTKDLSLAVGDQALMMQGGNGDWEADMVFVDYGEEKDLKKGKVKGKIVVAICGAKDEKNPQKWLALSREKRKRVRELGGLALVELYNSNQIPWLLLVNYLNNDKVILDDGEDNDEFLSLWVNDANNDRADSFQKGKLAIKIEGANTTRFKSQNVVGYLEGTDPELKDEYIMYSAHYDHVGIGLADDKGDTIYNGARDNAVGTVTVLSMAENLAKYPTKRSALFVLFTGEEKGLLGSKYYADNPMLPLKDVVYCFNSDGAGYNDTSLVTIFGLNRTTGTEEIKKGCSAYGLKAIDDPAPEQNLFDRSDNVSFAKKGVPAPTFSLGFTAFDEKIGEYYHRPGDEPSTLDYDYLYNFFRAYVYTGRLIADKAERPFWTEGDKYYDAGVQLYQE